MPDTGAPWNIPYVAGTDLVADWPTDNQTQAEAIAAALTSAQSIVQVVSALKTDTFSATPGGTYTDITDLSVTLTPSTNTNKVLLYAMVMKGHSTDTSSGLRFLRDATPVGVGAAAGSRTPATTARYVYNNVTVKAFMPETLVWLDSPATTSAVTYKVQIDAGSGTVYVNRDNSDGDSSTTYRTASSLIAIEVAA